MSYNQNNCQSSQYKNTGFDACDLDLSGIALLILTKESFDFDSQTDAETLANWTTAIQAKNIWPLPKVFSPEDLSEDDSYEDSPLGYSKFTREGRYRHRYMLDAPLYVHQNMRYFNGEDLRVIKVDINGHVIGTSPDGAIFKGFAVDQIRVEKIRETDGNATRKSPIYIAESDPGELNDFGASFKPTWNPITSLKGLKDCDVTVVGTPSATEIVVDVKTHVGQVGVSGLVVADFELLTAAGAAQSISTATESSSIPGRYTLAGSAWVTGTIDLAEPLDMTTTGYDALEAATVTIA